MQSPEQGYFREPLVDQQRVLRRPNWRAQDTPGRWPRFRQGIAAGAQRAGVNQLRIVAGPRGPD